MKVFITWSGPASHKVALALRDWLPTVVPAASTFVSSEDLQKGRRWLLDMARELEQTNFGIVCVVPGNEESPWINFEAGALSASLERSMVAPFLVGADYFLLRLLWNMPFSGPIFAQQNAMLHLLFICLHLLAPIWKSPGRL